MTEKQWDEGPHHGPGLAVDLKAGERSSPEEELEGGVGGACHQTPPQSLVHPFVFLSRIRLHTVHSFTYGWLSVLCPISTKTNEVARNIVLALTYISFPSSW